VTPKIAPGHATTEAGALRDVAPRPIVACMLVLVLSAFALGWNLTKAYHIDDTAYLEIAQWIAGHPLHPMRGTVFWAELPEGIDRINQPHGYLYLMAAWGSLFGWSEVAMHSLLAVFALGAVVFMYRIARHMAPGCAALTTALVAASPAFVVGQNTFVDVPLVALWLLFFSLLLTGRPAAGRERGRYLLAGLVCGVAILVKYTSLILLPALVLDGLFRRRPACLIGVATASVIIVAWCAFNYWDYGGVHMLSRDASWKMLDVRKWLLCLGAAAPFSFALAAAWLSRRSSGGSRVVRLALLAGVLAVLGAVVAACVGLSSEAISDAALLIFFIAGGAMLVALAALALPSLRPSMPVEDIDRWMLAYWAMGAAAFIVLLAPFVAVRHVLLALPPIALLAVMSIPGGPGPRWSAVAVVVTVGVTSIVAAADRWYAQIYRDAAVRLRQSVPAAAKVWTLGHWGWQWYARENGMTQYIPGKSRVAVGDYIVYPMYAQRQAEPAGITTIVVSEAAIAPENWPHMFAVPDAGFYQTSSFARLPWAVRRGPIEVFRVLRVEAN
jgi:4-amino-4-deoxy-L-arabinose transferase-like glycosyltransferase